MAEFDQPRCSVVVCQVPQSDDDRRLGARNAECDISGPHGARRVHNQGRTGQYTGVFIFRSANGAGSVNFPGVRLKWSYGSDGVGDNDLIDVWVFAIEMVLVPEGAFAAGSGGSEILPFTLTTINTVDATVAPSGSGSLGGQAGGYPTGQTVPGNASWPNGFSTFYCMKYEISQGQYADFLNSLTTAQAGNRFPNRYGNKRHTIRGGYPYFTASVPDRACNFISWTDSVAYADWSGLRPMTELEYEKACRGTKAPVANEYAWGTTSIYGAHYTLINDGTPMAQISDMGIGVGNASYCPTTDGSFNGQLRCGIFAASDTAPDRVETGASFYGIMELSGNLCERPVTIGNATGRAFTGLHGDGLLTAVGSADVVAWPADNASGAGFRGGHWYGDVSNPRSSDRAAAADSIPNRGGYDGFRCVRSGPVPFIGLSETIPSQAPFTGGDADGYDKFAAPIITLNEIIIEFACPDVVQSLCDDFSSGAFRVFSVAYLRDEIRLHIEAAASASCTPTEIDQCIADFLAAVGF